MELLPIPVQAIPVIFAPEQFVVDTSFQQTGYRSVKLEKALRKVGTDFQLSNLGLLSSFLNSAPQAARRSFSYLFLLRRVRGSHG